MIAENPGFISARKLPRRHGPMVTPNNAGHTEDKMGQRQMLRYLLLLPVALLLAACSNAGAQAQPTISVIGHSCSYYGQYGSCQVTVSWDDPNNPYPPDYVRQGDSQDGWFSVASGNSGEYTAYGITIFPVAFQPDDAQGNELATVWCWSNAPGSISCD